MFLTSCTHVKREREILAQESERENSLSRGNPVCTSRARVNRALQPPPGAGAGGLASPALPTPTTCTSARRPRRLRRASVARRSSGAWSAGCAAQPDSLRAPLIRRGAAVGAATAHAALCASPSCPSCVVDATCGSTLPCPSLPSRKQTHTHTQTHTYIIKHRVIIINY